MSKNLKSKNIPLTNEDVLTSVALRAHYLANQMIYVANHRTDKKKGDPKVGGHASASSSALHILACLHLVVKSGFDHISNKPHASPADHSFNYLLDLFLKSDLSRLSLEEANQAMRGLRAFPESDEQYVFQSYHSPYDPDFHNFFPSGTVGIPPVQAGYLALAYDYAKRHGYKVPEAHFWSIIGDSEFREGSLFEAVPDFAERQIGNLTWIVDYNRQSLDGHRITNINAMGGTDAHRIEATMKANGWDVIQVRHGEFRQSLFELPGGDIFKQVLEEEISDYELQVLLQLKDAKDIRADLEKRHKKIGTFLKTLKDADLVRAIHDLGGHCFTALIEALEESKKNSSRPCLMVVHTIKGWGLDMAASPGNHSSIPDEEEMKRLQKAQGLREDTLFARFDAKSEEGKFLQQRGAQLYAEIQEQHQIRKDNETFFKNLQQELGEIPDSLSINLKMASYPHTQWMLGQLTAKLTRIANTPLNSKDPKLTLPANEKAFHLGGEMIVSMAPDVGTSTNLNPAMDGKIFSSHEVDDIETEMGVKDKKTPDLVPGMEESDRFLRFDIVEANVMSCMGSFGKLKDILGIPILPLMTVYDFFIKRALDQLFYDLYWKSSFILVGTPSGVTLSPEGAQHGWKSDIQIPNQITWEPYFCQELDWILVDAIKRHLSSDNKGRTGVIIRGATRGAEQKELMKRLQTQRRFKTGLSDADMLCHQDYPLDGALAQNEIASVSEEEIFQSLKSDVLSGAYYLIDYRGYAGYEPGDNVVNIFALGALGTEAIAASDELLKRGIYANVIMVTCTDLLVGNLAFENGYTYLRSRLGVNADLHIQPKLNGHTQAAEFVTVAGRRIPVVSVHDGEPGLLDNIGSIIGVRHESLSVRKHSRCGRPDQVYRYHGIDADSIQEACLQVLSETALENIHISRRLVEIAAEDESSSSALRSSTRDPYQ